MSLSSIALFPLLLALPQDSLTQPADTLVCDGQVISTVTVSALPPAAIARSNSPLQRTLLRIAFQSSTTREDVLRSFLLVEPGQACNPRRLEEAARVLRAQPFIAAVNMRTSADSAGGLHLEVETLDEIPLVIGGAYNNGISALRLGNSNIAGYGLRVAAAWKDGGVFQDAFAFEVQKYGLFSKPLVLAAEGVRGSFGDALDISFSRPFFSNIQKFGWHAGLTQVKVYQPFIRPKQDPLGLELDRLQWSLGGVARLGGRSVGMLLGPVVMYDRVRPAESPVVISDSGYAEAAVSVLDNRYANTTTFRAGVTAGVRLLSYRTVSGFDALSGEQDIARGLQVGTIVARGFEALGAEDLDDFASADLYLGAGGGRSFIGLRGKIEGQRPRGGGEWTSVIASARTAIYYKSSERDTWELSTEYSGAWREKVPLQLSLGSKRAGPRGFDGSSLPSGRRVVTRLENRHRLGAIGPFASSGIAGFVDAARAWAGSAPYGEDVDMEASVGLGLLFAIPQESRRVLRFDVALPLTGRARDSWQFRVTVRDATRIFWREPRDVARSRSSALPATMYGWP